MKIKLLLRTLESSLKKLIYVPLWLLFIHSSFASEWVLERSFYIDSLYAFSFDQPSIERARKLRLHSEVGLKYRDHSFFTAFDFAYNRQAPEKHLLLLKEAFWEWADENFDMRLGRQILVWGKADGLAITDILSPKDQREYIALDYQDTRLPVDAFKLRYLTDNATLELVWIPLPAFDRAPHYVKNPLTSVMRPQSVVVSDERVPVYYSDRNKPNHIRDGEWAVRSSFYWPGIDLSLSWFHGWDRRPWLQRQMQIADNKIRAVNISYQYQKINMLGIDAAIPVGDWVWRLEGAWFGGRRYANHDGNSQKNNQLLLLGGFDWSTGKWMITGQYLADIISDSKKTTRKKIENTATISISRAFLRDTLTMDASAFFDLDSGGGAYSLEGEYAIDDHWRFSLGAHFFDGGGESRFSALRDLSALWLKVQYVF